MKAIEPNVASYEAMKKSGLNLEIFSGGGTGTYNIMHAVPGFTDVQVGSYLFMDMQYLAIGSESGDEVFTDFAPSLTVLATVLNNRFPGRLTTDAGAKALTLNTPTAGVIGEPGMEHRRLGRVRQHPVHVAAIEGAKIGDVLEVIVPHCDPAVNEFDQMCGIRKTRSKSSGRSPQEGSRSRQPGSDHPCLERPTPGGLPLWTRSAPRSAAESRGSDGAAHSIRLALRRAARSTGTTGRAPWRSGSTRWDTHGSPPVRDAEDTQRAGRRDGG